MKTLPPIEDDIFAGLQQLTEPLVDDVNSVLRRLLDHYRRTAGPPAGARIDPIARHGVAARPAPDGRARRGTTLPDVEFELPLLRALVKLDGRAATSQVTDEVGRILVGRLGAEDRATLRSGDVRWRNRTAFARLNLVKRGDMDGATPRGIWAITDEGRARVEAEPA